MQSKCRFNHTVRVNVHWRLRLACKYLSFRLLSLFVCDLWSKTKPDYVYVSHSDNRNYICFSETLLRVKIAVCILLIFVQSTPFLKRNIQQLRKSQKLANRLKITQNFYRLLQYFCDTLINKIYKILVIIFLNIFRLGVKQCIRFFFAFLGS